MIDHIHIIEKPGWVSWDAIKKCLMDAHAENRAKGINMTHYQWSPERIEESLGDKGVVLVALDGERIVGLAALVERKGRTWYANAPYAYLCFDAVIPEYIGKGVFKLLDKKREQLAIERGYTVLAFDTHKDNNHRQQIALKNGYRFVRFFRAASKDHYSVLMVKWLERCPFSSFYCCVKYHISRVRTIIHYPLQKSYGTKA